MPRLRQGSDLSCRRRLITLAIALQGGMVLACAPRRVPVLAPEYAFQQRDSVEQAFKAGVRDAWRLEHPNRSPGDIAMLAALPAGIFASRRTRNTWVLPGIWVGTGLGASLFAYHAGRKPLPLPPDSMRQHYALQSEVMWKRYQFGYQTVVDQSRQGKLERSTHFVQIGLVTFLVAAALTHR